MSDGVIRSQIAELRRELEALNARILAIEERLAKIDEFLHISPEVAKALIEGAKR